MSGASDDVKVAALARHAAAAEFDIPEMTPEIAARLTREGADAARAYRERTRGMVVGPGNPEQMRIDAATKPLHVKIEQLQAEVDRLTLLINTPRTDDFFEAVRIEAAHQIERWGVEHDAGKRPEDWIALVVYLLGKATKAHYENDRDKLLHHVITLAAVALNWHRNATGVSTLMRPGMGT